MTPRAQVYARSIPKPPPQAQETKTHPPLLVPTRSQPPANPSFMKKKFGLPPFPLPLPLTNPPVRFLTWSFLSFIACRPSLPPHNSVRPSSGIRSRNFFLLLFRPPSPTLFQLRCPMTPFWIFLTAEQSCFCPLPRFPSPATRSLEPLSFSFLFFLSKLPFFPLAFFLWMGYFRPSFHFGSLYLLRVFGDAYTLALSHFRHGARSAALDLRDVPP